MRLQMRRIDHQPRWLAGLARQFGKYLVEHTEAAPAHEPVIDRLVRTIPAGASRQRSPFLMTKTIPLITRRSSTLAIPCDNGKYPLDPAHLRLRQQKQISHGDASSRVTNESANHPTRKKLMGPDPNPFAGRYVEDLSEMIEASAEIGRVMASLAVEAMGPHKVEGYSKGGGVGLGGELEHANAMLTTTFATPLRDAIGGALAWIPSFASSPDGRTDGCTDRTRRTLRSFAL